MEMSKSQSIPSVPASPEASEASLDWSELTLRVSENHLNDFHRWLVADLDLLERELAQFASKQSRRSGRS